MTFSPVFPTCFGSISSSIKNCQIYCATSRSCISNALYSFRCNVLYCRRECHLLFHVFILPPLAPLAPHRAIDHCFNRLNPKKVCFSVFHPIICFDFKPPQPLRNALALLLHNMYQFATEIPRNHYCLLKYHYFFISFSKHRACKKMTNDDGTSTFDAMSEWYSFY